MTTAYYQGSVGTDPQIDYQTLPSGGIIVLKLYSSVATNWSLTRYIDQGGTLVSGTAIDIGTPVAPALAGAQTEVICVDANDTTAVPLNTSLQYVYEFTTSVGTIQTPPLVAGCSLEIVRDNITYLILKVLASSMKSLAIPKNYEKPTVIHAMPLTGMPTLPVISVNQSYTGQLQTPIGQATNPNIYSNTGTTTTQAQRIYSVSILTTTADEREFYRDAIIAVFNSILGPLLQSIGQDTSHDFSADSGQMVGNDAFNPGFFYADIMLKVSGTYNVIINSQYGLIEEFDGSATYNQLTWTF
ncbi:MAG: hypothetical protein KGI54_14995 [Pseudomonadota bacterium]|nr:hypothetical protein [Pseudomonadota bacterium]